MEKYVNITDIKNRSDDAGIIALVELLFFAYRDFVSDPDQMLDELDFGRAHHRVLHFVGRDPGMTVAQLLDILRITKQSLARVLKDLIDKGYVFQREGETDRRQRLLFLSPAGKQLHQRLMAPQISRIKRAIAEAGMGDDSILRSVFLHLVSPENRPEITQWVNRALSDA